jgi:hypothetical protein
MAFLLVVLFSASVGRGAPPLAEVPDFSVRVRVLKVGGQSPAPSNAFSLAVLKGTSVSFAGTDWSPWAESTREGIAAELAGYPNSYNRRWEFKTTCSIQPVGRPFAFLNLEVETRISGGEINRTPAELQGPALGLILWRDSGGPVHGDTLGGHGRRVYDSAMREAVLPPGDRPKRIVFGERYIGGDSDALCWREGIQRLCGLGFNALHSVPKDFIPVVRAGGITQLWGAVYNPPGYAFNFETNRAEIFRKFAADQIAGALADGWTRQEIALWVTSDEPGWYYPSTYKQFNDDPAALADFHAYLRAHGLRPKDLGCAGWDTVRLIGRKDYRDLPSRRLFYWSNRFVPWASSRFFSEVARAYEAELGTGVPVMVNFNNFLSRLYQPGPVGNNPAQKDPNAAMGQHDWLEFGRLRGSTCIATEDWFGDGSAAQWSFYATRLRSAGELSGVGFGALVIPRTSGQRPEGMAQKLLALVGQGAKTIKFFTFGPEYNFPGNCYSYNLGVFKPLSLGMGIVGRAEELLYPGRMRKPEVAILMPQSAQLWDLEESPVAGGLMDVTNTDPFRSHMAYMSETFGIHLALQHAAISAQAIDEEACAGRELTSYKVIYLTAPDLPKEAAEALLSWVKSGGTLVMTAGSGLFDRYHQPMNLLIDAAGVQPDRPVRPLLQSLNSLSESAGVTSGTNNFPSFGESEKLTVKGAQVRATFADGTPALTEQKVKRGRILRFASYPGLCYRRSATGTEGGLPAGFAAGWRELIVEPVGSAGVVRPVTVDRPLIEAPALYSEGGVAVTLLNWSGAGQTAVKLIVRTEREPVRVVSARQGPVSFKVAPATDGPFKFATAVSLDLADVDVLSVYNSPGANSPVPK